MQKKRWNNIFRTKFGLKITYITNKKYNLLGRKLIFIFRNENELKNFANFLSETI